MKKYILLITLGLVAIWAGAAGASSGFERVRTQSGEMVDALPNQVLVRYRNDGLARAAVLNAHNTRVRHRLERIGVDLITVPPGETLQSFLDRLNADPNVEFAEPNQVVRALSWPTNPWPDDPRYQSGEQYYLSPAHIHVDGAWEITTGAESVVVAVLDTGVDYTHPDLLNRMWENLAAGGTSGLHGTRVELIFDGTASCSESHPTNGQNMCAGNDPMDDNAINNGHGTVVAGIIAAEANNSTDIAGVAHDSRIMAVKVLNEKGYGTILSIVSGIQYAVENEASIINMSLGIQTNGESPSKTLESAINDALNNGVVVVAASGNDGGNCAVNYPAAYPGVIAVGSTNSSGTKSVFSCRGPNLDLVAPGEGIFSTFLGGNSGNASNGTSFSAPQVTGVAALLRSLDPNMPVDWVTRHLLANADDLGIPGKDNTYGYGRLNAYRAVLAASGGTIPTHNPFERNMVAPYPNPFNPVTSAEVVIAIPESLGDDDIRIDIYTLAGERVTTLRGRNTWDGRNDSGNRVASGLYFIHAQTSAGTARGRLTVLK